MGDHRRFFCCNCGFVLLFFFFFLRSLSHPQNEHTCKPFRCGNTEIGFPFWIDGLQDPSCGYPGFDLSCKDQTAFIYYPPLDRHLMVQSIDYRLHGILVTDENRDDYSSSSCFWCLFFKSFNVSAPPPGDRYPEFTHLFSNFTLVNCSRGVQFWRRVSRIAGLSDREHDAFVTFDNIYISELPVSCKPIKTISLPIYLPFYPYLNDIKESPNSGGDRHQYIIDLRSEMRSYANDSSFHSSYYSYYLEDYESYFNLQWFLPGCMRCDSSETRCARKDQGSADTLCLPFSQHDPHRKWVIAALILGSFLLLTVLAVATKLFVQWKVNRNLDLENEMKLEQFLESYKCLKPTRYSYADIRQMTNQFRENLGQGGYGSVFKGAFSNGTPVAVKLLNNFDIDGLEFMNEVATMGKIHHVNVVRLLGFCADRLKRPLVYEFMPRESLEKYIVSSRIGSGPHFLEWEKLRKIALGIARGVDYLHQGCDQRILHFDIKPHNILLDENLVPKISDFGLAKLCSKGQSAVSVTHARGTMGYIAPEVFSRNFGNISSKSDVYSYGMLLLEMVGGRRRRRRNAVGRDAAAAAPAAGGQEAYFPQWIYRRLISSADPSGDEDPYMGLEVSSDEDAVVARKLIITGIWCIQWNPVDRPPMSGVVQMLEGSVECLAMPPDPFASTASTGMRSKDGCPTNLVTIEE